MSKWTLQDDVINNSISDLSDKVVMVRIEHIKKLDESGIPYITFSDEATQCYFVKKGKKHKKFSLEQCEEIKNYKKMGCSYRELSKKFNASTRTIQKIIKGEYLL